jgi:hypothetical protein
VRNRWNERIIGQELKTLLFDTYAQALCPSIKATGRHRQVLTQNQILKQQTQKVFYFKVAPVADGGWVIPHDPDGWTWENRFTT